MHKNKHISQEFVDGPYGGIRSLLAEWKEDDQSASGSGCRLNEGIPLAGVDINGCRTNPGGRDGLGRC